MNSLLSSFAAIWLLICVHCVYADILSTSVTLENLVLHDVSYGGTPDDNVRMNARVSFGLIKVKLSEQYRVFREGDAKTDDKEADFDLTAPQPDDLLEMRCGDIVVGSSYSAVSPFARLVPLISPAIGTSITSQLSNIYGAPLRHSELVFALPLQITTFSSKTRRNVLYKAPFTSRAFSKRVIDGDCLLAFIPQKEQTAKGSTSPGVYISTKTFSPLLGNYTIFPSSVPTVISSLQSPDLPASVSRASPSSPLYRTRVNAYRYLRSNQHTLAHASSSILASVANNTYTSASVAASTGTSVPITLISSTNSAPATTDAAAGIANGSPREEDIMFLSMEATTQATAGVGAGVQGTNFGEMASSHIEEAIEQLKDSVAEAFMQQTLFFLAQELPAALDMSFEHLVVNELMSSLQQPLNVIFPYSLAAAVQARLPPLVAKKVSDNVVSDVTMRVVSTVAERVQRKLARVLPENVEKDATANIVKGAGADLVHILSLSIPAALTPSLLHAMTHDPQQDYYCYYCEKRQLYCTFCHKQRTETARSSYYAEYYTGYYSRYYANYYKDFFLTIVEEDMKKEKQARVQTMFDSTWNNMNTLVLEQPYFDREDDHLAYKHKTPPEGIVESGPSGGVGEAWG